MVPKRRQRNEYAIRPQEEIIGWLTAYCNLQYSERGEVDEQLDEFASILYNIVWRQMEVNNILNSWLKLDREILEKVFKLLDDKQPIRKKV